MKKKKNWHWHEACLNVRPPVGNILPRSRRLIYYQQEYWDNGESEMKCNSRVNSSAMFKVDRTEWIARRKKWWGNGRRELGIHCTLSIYQHTLRWVIVRVDTHRILRKNKELLRENKLLKHQLIHQLRTGAYIQSMSLLCVGNKLDMETTHLYFIYHMNHISCSYLNTCLWLLVDLIHLYFSTN